MTDIEPTFDSFDAFDASNKCVGLPNVLWKSDKVTKQFNSILAAQYTDITFDYPVYTPPGKAAKTACNLTLYLYGQSQNE